MSILGQFIMTGVSGTSLTKEEETFIQSENIGGVLLFSHNFETPAQLAELINSIQALRDEYPLFIAVDHEGGRVIRFKKHFTQIPSMLDIAKLDSPKLCFHVGRIMAEELSACGVNVNLSPVCDIFNNPANKVIGDRAFGRTGEEVSKYVTSMIRGLQTSGVLGCAKHFPGHGSTFKDSHFDMPVVKKSLEELEKEEFVPFVRAAKSRVEFMMMAHLMVDAIDKELPTSLSAKAYNLIRKTLKFNKIIISDDMQMKAIDDRYSTEEAAVLAIKAGADIIEYRDMEKAQLALEALKEARKTQILKNEVLNFKYQRIMDCKKQHFSEYKPVYIPEITKAIRSKANDVFMKDLISRIQAASVEGA